MEKTLHMFHETIKSIRLVIGLFIGLFTSISLLSQVSITTKDYTPDACRPQKIEFKGAAPGALNYQWFWDDGTSSQTNKDTITHVYKRGGHYKVQLHVTGNEGYIGSNQYDIFIGGLNANINASTDSACIGEMVYFSFYPNMSNFQWNFNDPASGNLNTSTDYHSNHVFSGPGSYMVMLVANTSCGFDTVFHKIYVGNNAVPKADFWFSNRTACPGDEISFSMSNHNASKYTWTFGDPASGKSDTSNVSNPSHFYSSLGKYIVKLMVQNQCGQLNSRTDSVFIINNAEFPQHLQVYTNGSSELSGCPGDVFNLYTDYNTNNMLWKFGDGDSSTNSKPSHVYTANGNYILSLKLINGCGNDTTIYNQVVIGNKKSFSPYASIEVRPKNACPGDAVSFSFKESAISYYWSFGDGVTSNIPNPSHSFLTTGVKTVSLNVTNNCGSDSVFTTQVNVADTIKPVLTQSGDKGGNWGSLTNAACPGDSIMFYSFDGTVCVFDFGDGTVSDQTSTLIVEQGEVKIIKHAYASIGTYTVKLTIFNYCGNSTTDSMSISVGNLQPITGELGIISNDPYYTCHKVQFMGTMGTNFIWYLPDGDSIVSDLNILDYSFSQPGSYVMKLKVTNGCGNSAIFTRDINIVELPKPVVIQHFDSLIVKTDATYYQWYRDGDSITGADKSIYRFNKSGKYSVKIIDKHGCLSTSDDYAICFVYAGEDVSVCPGGFVQLSASGTDNYSWTPSSGLSNDAISNPTAQPTSDTQYIVTGTSVGCIAKDSVTITLVAVLNAVAGNDVTICSGDSLILEGSGGGDYNWNPSTSLQYPNTAFPLAKPVTNTTYTLTVSSGSCTDTDEVIVTVQPKPTLSVVADDNICVGNTAQLQASVTNASGIEWKGIGSFTPDKYQNNVTYTPSNGEKLSGLATIYVNTMGTGACATLNKTVSINLVIVEIPVITLKNDTLFVPAGYSGYQWYKAGNIINGAIERVYKPTANDTYTVVAFGTYSCFSTSEPYNYIATKLNNDLSAGYTMYPNPVHDILNVKTGDQKAILTIYSIDGRVLSTISLTGNDNKISVNNLRPGAYYLRIQSSGNSFVVKMIKE